jgi:hypothetical protein
MLLLLGALHLFLLSEMAAVVPWVLLPLALLRPVLIALALLLDLLLASLVLLSLLLLLPTLILLALLVLLLAALILMTLLRGGLLRVAPFLLPLLRRSLLLTAVVLLLVLMLVFRLLGVAKRAGSESQGHYRCCGEDSNSLHGSSFRTGSEPRALDVGGCFAYSIEAVRNGCYCFAPPTARQALVESRDVSASACIQDQFSLYLHVGRQDCAR